MAANGAGRYFPLIWTQSSCEFAVTHDKQMLYAGAASFNRTNSSPIIRKASGHGLGHLIAPYDESPLERRAGIERIGVRSHSGDTPNV
jgi:hypothetical protein